MTVAAPTQGLIFMVALNLYDPIANSGGTGDTPCLASSRIAIGTMSARAYWFKFRNLNI
jgi:hypothetical protein